MWNVILDWRVWFVGGWFGGQGWEMGWEGKIWFFLAGGILNFMVFGDKIQLEYRCNIGIDWCGEWEGDGRLFGV